MKKTTKKKKQAASKPAYRAESVKFSSKEYASLRVGLEWLSDIAERGDRKTLHEWDKFVAEIKNAKA